MVFLKLFGTQIIFNQLKINELKINELKIKIHNQSLFNYPI